MRQSVALPWPGTTLSLTRVTALLKMNPRCPFAFRRLTLGAFLGIGLFCGCESAMKTRLRNAPPDKAAKVIEAHLDYCSRHLQAGMSRDEALALLPRPQNTDNDAVCVWIFDYSEHAKANGRFDWQWLQSTKGGFFVVFVEGKLATPLCANAAFTPWEALQHYAKLSGEQAEQILGRRP